MLWLTRLIRGALYPGAPFERQFMALEAMQLMLQVCPPPTLIVS